MFNPLKPHIIKSTVNGKFEVRKYSLPHLGYVYLDSADNSWYTSTYSSSRYNSVEEAKLAYQTSLGPGPNEFVEYL